jgi:hypothetical protein
LKKQERRAPRGPARDVAVRGHGAGVRAHEARWLASIGPRGSAGRVRPRGRDELPFHPDRYGGSYEGHVS